LKIPFEFQGSSLPSFSFFLESRHPLGQTLVRERGVSLMELLAVVCILGVISAFGLVSFKPLWQKNTLQTAARELESRMQFLRMRAILENSTIEMKISGHYLVYRKKEGTAWWDWKKHRLDDRIQYRIAGSIYFDQKGFTTPKTITLNLNQLTQKIIININGRIRTSEII